MFMWQYSTPREVHDQLMRKRRVASISDIPAEVMDKMVQLNSGELVVPILAPPQPDPHFLDD